MTNVGEKYVTGDKRVTRVTHLQKWGSRRGGGQGHGLGLQPRAMESFPGVGVLWCQPGARTPWCTTLVWRHRCMAEVSGSACKWPACLGGATAESRHPSWNRHQLTQKFITCLRTAHRPMALEAGLEV